MHANALLRGSPLVRRTHAPARGPVTDEDRKTLGRPLARTAAQHALAGNQGTDAMAQHTHLAEALATLDALVAAVGPAVAALLLAEQVPSWPGLATWRLGLTRGVAATERAVGLVCPALVPATPWTGTPTRPGDTVRPTHYLKPSALRPAADDPVEGPLVLVQAVARLPGAGACAGGPGADALDAALRSVALPADGAWVQSRVRVVRRALPTACETSAVGLWRLPPALDTAHARAALTRLTDAVNAALVRATPAGERDVLLQVYDPVLHGPLDAWTTGRAANTRTRDAFPAVGDTSELPLRLPDETPHPTDALYTLTLVDRHPVLAGWSLDVGAVNTAIKTTLQATHTGVLEAPIPRVGVNADGTDASHTPARVVVGMLVPGGLFTNLIALPRHAMGFDVSVGTVLVNTFTTVWRAPAGVSDAQMRAALEQMTVAVRRIDPGFAPATLAPFHPATDGALAEWQSGEVQRRAEPDALNPFALPLQRVQDTLVTAAKVGVVGLGLYLLVQAVSLYRAARTVA